MRILHLDLVTFHAFGLFLFLGRACRVGPVGAVMGPEAAVR